MRTERSLNMVAEVVRDARDRKGATVLIGAGMSVSAGIPGAAGIVEAIKARHPERCKAPGLCTYGDYMRAISSNDRKRLLVAYTDQAKINWAHIALAQLIAHGHVTRVLTTNFDPLVSRACALINVFPAIYDFADPPPKGYYRPAMIHDPSVFHLHGQYTGFTLKNTDHEFAGHAEKIAPLLTDSIDGRPLIIVGYSGECDPVFQALTQLSFGDALYWIGYKDKPLAAHVRDELLDDDKSAYSVSGYDADGFFCELAHQLRCFPPKYVGTPFSHLKSVLVTLQPYIPHGSTEPNPILDGTFGNIEKAIASFEAGSASAPGAPALPSISELWSLVMAGEYEQAAGYFPDPKQVPADYHEVVSEMHHRCGIDLYNLGRQNKGVKARRQFEDACAKYAAAIAIKPDNYEAFYNWGIALDGLARQSTGTEARRYFEEACEKFAEAIAIKPDYHEAFNNWGIALDGLAQQSTGAEAQFRFEEACEKYAAAIAFKQDYHEASRNWGGTLIRLSYLQDGAQRRDTLMSARDRLLQAEALQPGAGAFNLACIAALLGEPDTAKTWLEKSQAHGRLPSRAHLDADADLDALRDAPWFQALLASLPVAP